MPSIDEAALAAARAADRLLGLARERGIARWETFLARYPDLLRDAPPAELRGIGRRLRAAYGPQDSIADALPWDACMALRDALDVLTRLLMRAEAAP